jgi:amino acid adenylation domain-containing protein/non-ribosomal peptide synthase protein (TIGR01720 family)/FkbM family methyltransferase
MSKLAQGYKLSSPQRLIWRLRQHGLGERYSSYCCVAIDGRIERGRLITALETVLNRNEILRTNFRTRRGVSFPLQFISDSHSLDLPEIDLGDLPEDEMLAHLDHVVKRPERSESDLTSGAPLYARLYKISESRRLLLLMAPALCADSDTMVNIVEMLAQSFKAVADDEPPVLPDLQYLDIIDWQSELMESDETEAGRIYWTKQVAGAKPVRSLLWRESTRQNPAPGKESYTFRQDERLLNALRSRASAEGLTLPDLFLACWCALLRRYSEDDSVAVRTACNGRLSAPLENALGPLTKFLPMQTEIALNDSLMDVARKVGKTRAELVSWADYFSGEEVYQFTQDGFDCVSPFSFECRYYPHQRQAGEATFSIIRCHACVDWFGLKLTCSLSESDAEAELHYDERLFSFSEIERIAAQWQKLLQALVDSPQSRICDLDIVGDAERRTLVQEWNDTAAAYPRQRRAQELFVEQARLTPDRIAVIFEEQQLSYEELCRQSSRLAGFLRAQGVCEETVVAIYLNRSVEALTAILGVLMAGGAYLPLDTGMPEKRLEFILGDAKAALILSVGEFEPELSAYGIRVFSMDKDWNRVLNFDVEPVGCRIDAENICYVIYTSGSTGRPKGVMVTHGGLVNYLWWCLKTYALSEGAGCPLHTSLAFDLTVTSLFPPLLAGRTVTLLRGEDGINALAERLGGQEGFSLIKLTPAHLAILTELCQGLDVSGSTKALIIGGEQLRGDLLGYWKERAPAVRLINEYGPTETVVGCCVYEAPRDFPLSGAVPIGRPISNVGIYLLDTQLNLVPIGMPGEIYISGDCLARGYVNRPDLTADRFIPNALGEEAGSRLYKTGDLSRYLPDGNLEFLGRSDHQIKLHGRRIELGEIEAVLGEHGGAQDVVVIVGKAHHGGQRLIAYVVPHPYRASVVRNWLRMKAEGRDESGSAYELPNGLLIYHLNPKETEYLYQEIFLDELYGPAVAGLPDGACVLDVGANIGMFSLWVKRRSRGARIFAFEPIPPIYEALERNAMLYGGQIRAFHCGLSKNSGQESFSFYPNLSLMSGRFPERIMDREVVKIFESNKVGNGLGGAPWGEGIFDEVIDERLGQKWFDCPVTTVSEVIRQNNLTRVDLLKIDAEKSELDVLEGIEEEDWEKIERAVIEVHDVEGRLDRISSLFQKKGYRVTVKQEMALERTNLHILYAARERGPEPDLTKPGSWHEERQEEQWQSPAGLIHDIQCFLRERLPDYMVPEQVVLLDALPLTSNLKVDRRGLPAPEVAADFSARPYVEPSTPAEKILTRIWQEVLGKERISVDESFFAMGGDSIMSIQVIARSNQAGLHLTPRQFFRHQTIQELAAVAGVAPRLPAEVDVSTDEIALTPVQRWFFERCLTSRNHYNQSVLLEFDDDLNVTALTDALRALVDGHDAFRLRFHRRALDWRQALEAQRESAELIRVDLSALAELNQIEALERVSDDLQRSLDLAEGPIYRMALFRLATTPGWRLLFIIHHLGVDGVSWRILLEELDQLYRRHRSGQAGALPVPGAGFREWASRLRRYASQVAGLSEVGYWTSAERETVRPLPVDYAGGENLHRSCQTVSVSLTEEETECLLQEVCHNLTAQIEEVLLATVSQALARWSGRRSLLLDIERHGRDSIIGSADFFRTVGWFTTIAPVLLRSECLDNPLVALKRVQEQLRAMPNKGAHYGILRYFGRDEKVTEKLRALPQAQISFNYLGRFDQVFSPDSPFRLAKERTGNSVSPEAERPYLLDWVGWISGRQMKFDCRYSETQFNRSTIEEISLSFTRSIRDLIALGRRPSGASRSISRAVGGEASPFSHDDLSKSGLEVEDVYPLSPIQQGILFHHLRRPEGAVYVAQSHCVFTGDLKVAALEEAWQKVGALHPVIRTAYLWEGLEDPCQVVIDRVKIPWVYHDWTDVDPVEQQWRLARLLQADWEKGFDLSRPPLLRLSLIQRKPDVYDFVWTYHHISFDGWSVALLLRDVFDCYKSILHNRRWEPRVPRPYRDYIQWLSERNDSTTDEYWDKALKDFSRPTPLGMSRPDSARHWERASRIEEGRQMGEALKSDLLRLARRERLTLNTMALGAWALLLHLYSREQEVVFGVTLSGRPTELADSETMVGLFINTLPIRISLSPSEGLLPWLGEIQRRLSELIQYQHTSLAALKIHRKFKHVAQLFESILVFENYPIDDSLRKVGETIRVQNIQGKVSNHYSLTVRVAPNAGLLLEIMSDESFVDLDTARRLLGHFERLFRHFVTRPEDNLRQIMGALADADRQQLSNLETESSESWRRLLKVAQRRSVTFKKTEG